MDFNTDNHRLIEKEDFGYIAILLVIALGIGVYIIATTVLIAQDGVLYINNAKVFESDFVTVLQQHWPGYPFLVFALHSFINLFHKTDTIYSWIYCGQAVSLLSRVLSLIPLYLIGKVLVGKSKTLWALLILVLLPYPAEFGSDVIREWPHILFLATGMALLIYGAKRGKWWMFGLAGLTAGLGHTIRPECAQVVIYGVVWLLLCLIIPRAKIGRIKVVVLMLVLLAGFAIPAVPYVNARGRILPVKLKSVISCNTQYQAEGVNGSSFDDTGIVYTASGVPTDILKAVGRLAWEISDNLMYFFMLPFAVGIYWGFRRIRKAIFDEKFFILCLLVLYSAMMVLLHINYGYISRRHCMAMVIFGIFYIPGGLELIAGWVEVNIFRNKFAQPKDVQRVFLILLCIGLGVCVGKFNRITPLRAEKQSYLQAAGWLKNNTQKDDKIAVFDARIGMYSERKCQVAPEDSFPEGMDYIVKQFDEKATPPDGWDVQKKFTEGEYEVVLYGKP